MICPECEDEFRDGIERCPDCDVDLVAQMKQPPAPEPDRSEGVELFWASDPGFLAIAKSILEGASIAFWVQGEESMALFGTPKSLSSQVYVPQSRYDEAMALLMEAELDVGQSETTE